MAKKTKKIKKRVKKLIRQSWMVSDLYIFTRSCNERLFVSFGYNITV